jgi:CheY-like chemotaxis protein
MASILIVGDSDGERPFLLAVLSWAGHTVREASDAPAAVKAHAQAPADLVLCDVSTPGKDVLAAAREVRQGCPGVRMILLADAAAPPQGVDALGAVGVLYKPFGGVDLVRAVSQALSG